jgi:transposase
VDASDRAVVKRVLQRRRRSVEEKRQIVEETLQAGASVAGVARAHGVNANQVFTWRRQYHRGQLERGTNEAVELLPVRVVEAASETARSRSAPTYRTAPGMIHVELPKGQASTNRTGIRHSFSLNQILSYY